jgi:cytochrome c oxidase subunit 2
LFRKYVFSLDHKVIGLQYALKQDAIPGIEQRLWFTPTRTGEWEIACSQLCGLGHYRMRGFYVSRGIT